MCYDISIPASPMVIQEVFPDLPPPVWWQPAVDILVHLQAQSWPELPALLPASSSSGANKNHSAADQLSKNTLDSPLLEQEQNLNASSYQWKQMEWGLIAPYMNTPEKVQQYRPFLCNAQSEKMCSDRKSIWHRIRHNRCLIPVSGFYEHRHLKGWKQKVPYFIQIKKQPVFFLAGLYQESLHPDPHTGELKTTLSIVTRPANALLKKIHNAQPGAERMPLLLPNELVLNWIQPLTDEELLRLTQFELPAESLDYWPVAPIRNKDYRPDGLPKNAPYKWPNLPGLEASEDVQKSLF
jgi:putative SOS response-associated peptidase YedK